MPYIPCKCLKAALKPCPGHHSSQYQSRQHNTQSVRRKHLAQVNTAPSSYVRPKMREKGPLAIVEGRHPLMEQLQGSDDFTPNDTYLAGTCLPLLTPKNGSLHMQH